MISGALLTGHVVSVLNVTSLKVCVKHINKAPRKEMQVGSL